MTTVGIGAIKEPSADIELEKLKASNAELKKENKELKASNAELKKENKELKASNAELKKLQK